MSSISKHPKAQFVAVDEDTAKELKLLSRQSNMSIVQLMRNMSTMYKYAMGRKVRITSSKEKKYASFDYEDYEKVVEIEE